MSTPEAPQSLTYIAFRRPDQIGKPFRQALMFQDLLSLAKFLERGSRQGHGNEFLFVHNVRLLPRQAIHASGRRKARAGAKADQKRLSPRQASMSTSRLKKGEFTRLIAAPAGKPLLKSHLNLIAWDEYCIEPSGTKA
jgi:hypothetical protein